jgi:hypothetical protein
MKYKHSNKMNVVPPRSAKFISQTHQNSLLINGLVSGSGWEKFIISCPFQLGSLRLRGYGTSGLKCASRNCVVECGASVNIPLSLASFVFSNCPIGLVFVSHTFGLMTTPQLLGLVTGLLEHFPISLSH